MDRKPERLSTIVFAISVGLLVAVAFYYITQEQPDSTDIVLPVIGFVFLMLTIQLFTRRLIVFAGTFVVQVAAIEIVLLELAGRSHVAEVALIVVLFMNLFLRLPAVFSITISAVVIGIPVVATGFVRLESPEHIVAIAIEIVFAAFFAVLVHYREALVKATSGIESQRIIINNLSAANESFVEQLPEMKRDSAEQERMRITRDLHDSLGYAMTNIVMIMNATQYLFEDNPSQVQEYCLKTKELASTTMDETRETLYRLRAINNQTPSNPSIFFHKLCSDFQEATGIRTDCHPGNLTNAVPERIFDALLRTIQAGFVNALRHSHASEIRVFFWQNPTNLQMKIWNSIDAADIEAQSTSEGIGLRGIRERMTLLGGSMRNEITANGYSLIITIPFTGGRHHDYSRSNR